MTLLRIAQLAGVSTSTVSRVVNNHPRVATQTVEAVRRAIEQADFSPRPRPRNNPRNAPRNSNRNGRRATGSKLTQSATVAFLVFGASGAQSVPAFEKLLRGVSAAAGDHDLDMVFSFISDLTQLPPKLMTRDIDGLLLHGDLPAPVVQERMQALPSVWLMANRQRPTWGDQIMPDNTVVGEVAARYLLRRGHRTVAFLSTTWGPWAMDIRSMSFRRAVEDAGGVAHVLHSPADHPLSLWDTHSYAQRAGALVEQLVALDPRPTGLFVAEDRQVLPIDTALKARGLTAGPGADVELISCNNERPYLIGLNPVPATIDIRPESIGRRGVEQLIWRIEHGATSERVRAMVEPVLVESVAEVS